MYNTAARDLLMQGVAEVPFRKDYQRLAQVAVAGFRHLLDEPNAVRDQWKNIDRDGFGEPEHGWLPKRGEEHELSRYERHDRKDAFHYHTDLRGVLERRGVEIKNYQHQLLDTSRLILKACLETLYGIAGALDVAIPGQDFLELMRASARANNVEAWHNHALRLLVYQTSEEDLVGKFHTDRDFLTLHLADSGPGLIDEKGRCLWAKPGRALVFAGDKAEYMTGGKLRALVHGVKNNEKQRWVVVCFGQTPTNLLLHDEMRKFMPEGRMA